MGESGVPNRALTAYTPPTNRASVVGTSKAGPVRVPATVPEAKPGSSSTTATWLRRLRTINSVCPWSGMPSPAMTEARPRSTALATPIVGSMRYSTPRLGFTTSKWPCGVATIPLALNPGTCGQSPLSGICSTAVCEAGCPPAPNGNRYSSGWFRLVK
jgi:hypothetical protein